MFVRYTEKSIHFTECDIVPRFKIVFWCASLFLPSYMNTKLFEEWSRGGFKAVTWEERAKHHTVNILVFLSEWSFHPFALVFSDPQGLYFKLTSVSLYSLCRCVSGLVHESHTLVGTDIHTEDKWRKSVCGMEGQKNAVLLLTLLPMTNLWRRWLNRLS